MNGVGFRIADGDVQQVVGKLRRGAVACPLRKVSLSVRPRRTRWPCRNVGIRRRAGPRARAAWLAEGESPGAALPAFRPFTPGVPARSTVSHTPKLFVVHRQDVLHAPDILLIQFRHAPHFFPAEPEIVSSCPSYKLEDGIKQVTNCLTMYVVCILSAARTRVRGRVQLSYVSNACNIMSLTVGCRT